MTRIIFICLLTLAFSCGNRRAETTKQVASTTEQKQETTVKKAEAKAEIKTEIAKAKTEAKAEKIAAKAEFKAEIAKAKTEAKAEKAAIKIEKGKAKAKQAIAKAEQTATKAETEAKQTEIKSDQIAAVAAQEAAVADQAASNTFKAAEVVTTTTTSEPAQMAFETPENSVILSPNQTQVKSKHFLPTRRRIDREINKLKFAYKGEVMMGLTASYGTLSSDDMEFLVIIGNIKANATIATVKPFFGYFYRDNHAIGARFGYSHINGSLKSAEFDMGAGMDGPLPKVKMASDSYSFGVFHRSYAGLDPKGRFGLFAEFELSASTGSSEFTYEQDGIPKQTFSDNTQVRLAFNPGAAVYIFPNVCTTLSFGLGGLEYTKTIQKDAQGNVTGKREASKMKFKFNIAAINVGMNIHLWDKKKR